MSDPRDKDWVELDALIELADDDPRRQAALRSPRLRNLLREHERFMAGASAPEEDVADAERRLAALPTRSTPRRSTSPRASLWGRMALAAAAVTVLAFGLRQLTGPAGQSPPAVRSETPAEGFAVEAVRVDQDHLSLHWSPVEGARVYRLLLLGSDLRLRGSFVLPDDGNASVDLSPYGSPDDLAFRVVALGDHTEIARSALRPVPKR